jgi:hypothetical protein
MSFTFGSKLSEISMYKVLGALSVPAAIVISGALVWNGSTAAFSGTTSNGPESWEAGEVALSNNHGSALFSASEIIPGYSDTKCITVTSDATVPTELKMYTSAVSATGPAGAPLLSSHLNVEVVEGSGGKNTEAGCVDFIPATGQAVSPSFVGTLASFANKSSFANGVGDYTLPAGGSRQYQVSVTLPEDAPNTLQGTVAGATFMWEAQG